MAYSEALLRPQLDYPLHFTRTHACLTRLLGLAPLSCAGDAQEQSKPAYPEAGGQGGGVQTVQMTYVPHTPSLLSGPATLPEPPFFPLLAVEPVLARLVVFEKLVENLSQNRYTNK